MKRGGGEEQDTAREGELVVATWESTTADNQEWGGEQKLPTSEFRERESDTNSVRE